MCIVSYFINWYAHMKPVYLIIRQGHSQTYSSGIILGMSAYNTLEIIVSGYALDQLSHGCYIPITASNQGYILYIQHISLDM